MKSLLRVENRAGPWIWSEASYRPPQDTQEGDGIYEIVSKEVSREAEESLCMST